MSPQEEAIARRLAIRFAPTLGDRLPDAVERAIEEGGDPRAIVRSLDPSQVLALGSFIVSVASLAWTIRTGLRAERREAEKERREILEGLQRAAPALPGREGERERLLAAAAEEAAQEKVEGEEG